MSWGRLIWDLRYGIEAVGSWIVGFGNRVVMELRPSGMALGQKLHVQLCDLGL